MTAVTGRGPWPGTDVLEAQSIVVGVLADTPPEIDGMPFTVQLAARGPVADATGSAVALLVDLPVELGTHGWKLADGRGRDGARARSLRREDLDALAVAAHGYVGPLVVPVTGPLTLAATLYLARGDRVLSDRGAVEEIAESYAVGVGEHVAAVRRAVPGAVVTLLVHEPLLVEVLAGTVRTFSGYAALRSVPGPVAGERIGSVVRAARAVGVEHVAVHAGSSCSVLATAAAAGTDAVVLAVAGLDDSAWERVAETSEGGVALWFELPAPSMPPVRQDGVRRADLVVQPWRRVGLPVTGLRDVVLLPGDINAGATPDRARAALADAVQVALVVAERAEG